MKDLVIIGAGGLGRETLDVVEAINDIEKTWNFLGFVDDGKPHQELLSARGAKWLGTREVLANYSEASFVIGISDPKARIVIAAEAETFGLTAINLIHPSVHIGSVTNIGAGAIICAGVSMTTNVTIGRHVQLNPGVRVGHDSHLDDFVSVYPGSIIGGNVHICREVTVGANATILQGIHIGEQVTVGAGAVVTRNVNPITVVKGIPAR